jgi:hypothetical protein
MSSNDTTGEAQVVESVAAKAKAVCYSKLIDYSRRHNLTQVQAMLSKVGVQGRILEISIDLDADFGPAHDDDDEAMACVALLLCPVREGKDIQTLRISSAPMLPIRQCLDALTTNPHIREFSLQDCNMDQIPYEELATLLRHTKTLRKLHVDMSVAEHELVAQALAANGYLTSLTLSIPPEGDLANIPITGTVLHYLSNHSGLRYLSLDFPSTTNGDELPLALSTFLARAPALTHLSLNHFDFDKNWTQYLMDGLLARKMIRTLELEGCSFDDEARRALASRALASYKYHETKIVIRELIVQERCRSGVPYITPLVLGLHCMKLYLDGTPSHFFWSALAAVGPKICLRRIQLSSFPHKSPQAMIASLPKWVSVQGLHFLLDIRAYMETSDDGAKSMREFCLAIRSNWSLHRMSAMGKFPVLSRAQTRMVRACLQRNSRLEPLLRIPACQRTTVHPSYVASGSIYPTLLSVAKQAPRCAPNTILLGLMNLSDSLGPCALTTLRLRT